MKKTLIIIGATVFVLLLLGGAWWYLLMNGAPEGFSIPNPFGKGSEEAFPTATEETGAPPVAPDLALRKLIDGPVAGAAIVSGEGTTTAPYRVRYIERGTGHMFEVSDTGMSERISGTTIPRITQAVWSPAGTRIALVTETADGAARVFAGTLERSDTGEGSLVTTELPSNARNLAFSETSESVLYTVPGTQGSVGYEQNLKTTARTVRFSAPLRDIAVLWKPGLVVYTPPTAALPGYAYEGTALSPLSGGRKGLMVISAGERRVFTSIEDSRLVSREGGTNGTALSLTVFPEKCAPDPIAEGVLFCGAPLAFPPGEYPDVWYRGEVSFSDSLWRLDTATGSATLLASLEETARTPIDVTGLSVSDDGKTLIFMNKKDASLWSYQLR